MHGPFLECTNRCLDAAPTRLSMNTIITIKEKLGGVLNLFSSSEKKRFPERVERAGIKEAAECRKVRILTQTWQKVYTQSQSSRIYGSTSARYNPLHPNTYFEAGTERSILKGEHFPAAKLNQTLMPNFHSCSAALRREQKCPMCCGRTLKSQVIILWPHSKQMGLLRPTSNFA